MFAIQVPTSRLSQFSEKLQAKWQSIVVFIPYVWLLIFFLVPFFIIFKISLAESLIASPPFSPLFGRLADGALHIKITWRNYAYLWQDPLYITTYINSLKISSISTLLCLLVGYPIAYAIVRTPSKMKYILLMLIILPFWTSFLIRVYAWIGLLADQGTINDVLIWLGVIDSPIRLLYTEFAVYLGIVYTYLPFMILPLYANMEKLDMSVHEAAADLGAKPMTIFITLTIPLTIPGIIAGCLLVFVPATGEYIIPELLGGGNVLMVGSVLYSEFHLNHDWPVASAIAIALLILLVAPIMWYQRTQAREESA